MLSLVSVTHGLLLEWSMRARILLLTGTLLWGMTAHSLSADEAKASAKAPEKVTDKADQMDWLKFWSTVIVSLPWPAVVLILAFGFKPEFKSILERLNKLKGLGIEAELVGARKEAEKESLPILTNPIPIPPTDSQLSAIPDDRIFGQLLSIFPASVIPLKWKQLEEELLKTLPPMAVLTPNARIPVQRIEIAIPPQYRQLFNQLRRIRNEVVHGQDPVTAPQAEEFIELADSLLAAVRTSQTSP